LTAAVDMWDKRIAPLLETRYLLDPTSPSKGDLPRNVIHYSMSAALLIEYEGFRVERPKELTQSTLEYWRSNDKFPNLKKYALRILSIPLSSTEAERAFSFMRSTEDPLRCRTKDPMFENEVFLGCHKPLIDYLMEDCAKQ